MYIFCTEPFRIPFAGRIDVACFDKTGTLTAENLIVEGVAGLGGVHPSDNLYDKNSIPKDTCRVLGAAHALALLDDGIIGDPMEKNTLEWINWTLSSSDTVSPKMKGSSDKMKIIRRFHFSSQLKRMSTVSSTGDGNKVFVAVKGAPETIQTMLAKVPEGYEDDYKNWARKGKRVLALAFKYLNTSSSKVIYNIC
jgi:cation-transporting ATPase 13A1